MTKDEIIDKMADEMPFRFKGNMRPYIIEAMEMYVQQQVKSFAIPDVSGSFCECKGEHFIKRTGIKEYCSMCKKEIK